MRLVDMTTQAAVATTASESPKTTDSDKCLAEGVAATTETENALVVEEDWSQFIITNDNAESTANALDENYHQDQSFSYYDTVLVPLSAGNETFLASDANINGEKQSQSKHLVMEIRCMESLTPLDMLDLSNGFSDATGNRIWMGAVFFLECMVRQISLQARENKEAQGYIEYNKQEQQKGALLNLRAKLFHKKRVLELGSGTGASLIAIGLAGARNETKNLSFEETENDETSIQPFSLTFTDNDENVLSLCKMNCDHNLQKIPEISRANYTIGKLDWGDFYNYGNGNTSHPSINRNDQFFLDSESLRGTLDTVVATDVIYDVASIPLLMATAEGLLKEGGFFVLAHVPRASIDCELSKIRESLEERILQEASRFGFETNICEHKLCNSKDEVKSLEMLFGENERSSILRPSIISQLWTKESEDYRHQNSQGEEKQVLSVSSDYDYEELESCGASVMIFVKNTENSS